MTRGLFVASDILPAADLNAVTNPPRCRIYNSANISLTSGTTAALTFDTEAFDNGMHSTSVNPSRITCPTDGAGWYHIGGCVRFAANATGYREIKIVLNGSQDIHISRLLNNGGTDDVRATIHTFYPLSVGDYVELHATQNSGGALNALGGFVYSPMFYASWATTFS